MDSTWISCCNSSVRTSLGIGLGLVDLVDRHHERDTGRLGMADRLDGLGHDTVIGGHDQHHDIGDLGTTGTHRRKGGVARRIDERRPCHRSGWSPDRRRYAG